MGLSKKMICLNLLLMSSVSLMAENWLSLRGPSSNGISKETNWNADQGDLVKKITWQKNVGIGASSVVVKGNMLVTMGNVDNHDIVACLAADTGKVLWSFKFPSKFSKRKYEGGTASTPTIDGDHVYVFSHLGDLYCLSLKEGKKVWQKNVVKDFKGKPDNFKYAGSPLIDGNVLVLDIGGSVNSTIGINKMTGEKLWGGGDAKVSYATPVAFKGGYVVPKKGEIIAINKEGKELWKIPFPSNYNINASSPIVMGDKVFLSNGYTKGRSALLQMTEKEPKQLWQNDDIKLKMSTAVIKDGLAFAVSGTSKTKLELICFDINTGKILWNQGNYGFGTLIMANDHLIILSEKGELSIGKANKDGFKAISKGQVLNNRSWVQPVIANGMIYCKDNAGNLVCVNVSK